MKKNNVIASVLLFSIIVVNTSFTFKESIALNIKSDRNCQPYFACKNNSSNTNIESFSIDDGFSQQDYFNISPSNFVNGGFIPHSGGIIEFAIKLQSNNSTGRIVFKKNNTIISCINIPANTNQVFLFFLNSSAECGSFYTISFENGNC